MNYHDKLCKSILQYLKTIRTFSNEFQAANSFRLNVKGSRKETHQKSMLTGGKKEGN